MKAVSFKRWFGLFVVALVMAGAWGNLQATHALAQSVSRQAMPRIAHDNSTPHVTIIILDMSGSMNMNDPNGIRCSAANAYIDLSGASDYIGVIGLDNNNGTSGGTHNFQFAQKWADPAVMTTVNDRQTLKRAIAAKSNNCSPDADTPTYDALQQALTMLAAATQNGKSGSVILLTDGTPYPDTDTQVSAINSELVPQFKKK